MVGRSSSVGVGSTPPVPATPPSASFPFSFGPHARASEQSSRTCRMRSEAHDICITLRVVVDEGIAVLLELDLASEREATVVGGIAAFVVRCAEFARPLDPVTARDLHAQVAYERWIVPMRALV